MGSTFERAVLEVLLPGESGERGALPPLPSGAAAGLDLAAYAAPAASALEAIRGFAGGEAAFLAGSREQRAQWVADAEAADAEAFRALVNPLLSDYCEHPAVLAAFGWRSEPPQPRGHALAEMDDEARMMLARVRERGRIWRG